MTDKVTRQTDARGVATLTLNRRDIHNAFDDDVVNGLSTELDRIHADNNVRVLIITGAGKSFSAGADLNWMRAMTQYDKARNQADAVKLAEMMAKLNELNKPTIARINGPTFGGGVGLVTCCDIAVAADNAKFALTEVKLGLVPAVISPYVIEAIGVRNARRFFLSAEIMNAPAALSTGLVHQVVKPHELDEAVDSQVELLLQAGPEALKQCKQLIRDVTANSLMDHASLRQMTADLIARLRISEEGQEGLSAFLEKRPPNWKK